MFSHSLWITGSVRSGKTSRLVSQLQTWVQTASDSRHGVAALGHTICPQQTEGHSAVCPYLVFAANADNRVDLANRLSIVTAGQYPVYSTTPLGFFQDEIVLFWPLLTRQLKLNAQFPLRLRPENEQELATQLWHQELDSGSLQVGGVSPDRLVRQALDLLQLAAFSGTPIEAITPFLQEGFARQETPPTIWDCLGKLLVRWRDWCLARGFLTYGILTELYWRHLLASSTYQQHLMRRYQVVLADDVDNYPAIVRDLFDLLLDHGATGIFTFNPDGAIRLGLGADPEYLSGLQHRCRVETLNQPSVSCLAATISLSVGDLHMPGLNLPESIRSIQTTSRAQLLRQTAETIIETVQSGQVDPQDVAVIGPGLDAIARYTLIEILTHQGIPVESLNDQRPLASLPIVRALLMLLALVYPGLGRLVDRENVAEMLAILSLRSGLDSTSADSETANRARIDPVRAGLLADYCFEPHPECPRLLPATTFPRWDRLGYQAAIAYEEILQWLSEQRFQQEQRLIPSPISVLDRAIQRFLWPSNLSYDQLAALRELLETAQHYWEIDARLSQSGHNLNLRRAFLGASPTVLTSHETVGRFIQLLRRGTITANPFPVPTMGQMNRAVKLATTFQYRSSRQAHRWHFWLDVGSSLWHGGGAVVLWGAPFFLKDWSRQPWTMEEAINNDQKQLQRLLLDLLSRVEEQVYLCHSDLSVSGQEQTGPLLPLVDASVPLASV